MYNGERPIGAAKGKQTNTMASCQNPPLGFGTKPRYQASVLGGGGPSLHDCPPPPPPLGGKVTTMGGRFQRGGGKF